MLICTYCVNHGHGRRLYLSKLQNRNQFLGYTVSLDVMGVCLLDKGVISDVFSVM